MYNLNDNASEAPLYLVPNSEGTGKRLVRRPHPPPTSAPLPDDFDAITDTRDGTTIYDDAGNSALGIDYDAMTMTAAAAHERPLPIYAPVPLSPTRNHPTSPLRQRRAASPSRSLVEPDLRSAGNGDMPHSKGLSHGKARSVAGDRFARRSLGTGNHPSTSAVPPPLPFPPGKGPAAGRNDLVEKKVLEDGPERTISVWRESVAKNSSEVGDGDNDGRSDLDSHAGRRRRVESVAHAGSAKSKGHRSKDSADFTEIQGSSLQPSVSGRSTTPLASALPINSIPQPSTPQKPQRRMPVPVSPSAGPKGSEYSASPSNATSQTKVTSAAYIESVLSSCRPSLLHLLPILEELGVRRSEHMTALARMREETRDREVKEEALKKGVTIVEWAILIDKLQSL
ncbi:hypothetical protein EI94DRAFT_1783871 [Lactarius quietus]|nr:hypothetical protein EI94DRAFT_1783871 [Lactarius quietus]